MMRNALLFLLASCAAFDAGAITASQLMANARAGINSSKSQADLSLLELQDVASAEGWKDFGFDTPGEGKSSMRGDAMPILIAPLDALQAFDLESDADILELLVPSKRVFYPVMAAGPNPEPRSGFEVFESSSGWMTSSLGGANYVRAIRDTLKAIDRAPAQTIIVEVPALRLTFIAYQEGTELKLASIVAAPDFDVPEHVGRDARAVLRSLVQPAKDHNGAPV